MNGQPKVAETATRAATASYVATLTAELSAMARKSGLNALGYILEMARLEAESEARRPPQRTNDGA
jgi:Mrp family chromosome partitioning ATPase